MYLKRYTTRNLLILWCRRPGLNRYALLKARDFKSLASANFATPAAEGVQWRDCNIVVLVGQGCSSRAHTV